ncbi:hypothetical protein VKT23_011794 [Stygiomarasmius scandens]|uniref:Mug135-like C-terminal domain-containing protein n=1 Tax=Marasmiellus scandens TaxID=2682957 RepID=A0ABR1JAP6_9AGAR
MEEDNDWGQSSPTMSVANSLFVRLLTVVDFYPIMSDAPISADISHNPNETVNNGAFGPSNSVRPAWADEILAKMDETARTLVEVHTAYYKRDNSAMSLEGPFTEILFADATRPWGRVVDGPDNTLVTLPCLSSLESVRNLSDAESYGYFKGYFPQELVPTEHDIRQKRILNAIGLRPDV